MNRQKLIAFSSFLFLLSALTATFGQSRATIAQLRQQIQDTLAKQEGVFAVAFRDLSSGQQLLIRENETFHAASTMKTPVLIEVYKQAAEKRLALTDSILIKNTFRSIVDGSPFTLGSAADSETKLYDRIGQKIPLSTLVYEMIIMSSNLATNLVIELVDAKKVTQTMRDLGAATIQVRRGVEDSKAFAQGLNNTTTAYDLLVIFEKIATGKAVSPEASQAMTGILLDQHFNSIIPANLPKEVRVAHKTGSITGVHHDSGFVILPDGRQYVLALLSKDLKNDSAATKAMASVSELIYRFVTQ
ncbi:serine hydrolase [Tellurirhabdus bombi]|uniref:serine hydrolase n=1 Tax=Tellurirhabdus bombi TaxID=2907205 RepID=UPI001F270F0A|nr:serine hydrolase [Tellurirhabdus bombi]